MSTGNLSNGGKVISTMTEREQEWLDGRPLLTRCAWCAWTHEGTAVEGRVAARSHRARKHPGLVVTRRRTQARTLQHMGARQHVLSMEKHNNRPKPDLVELLEGETRRLRRKR